MAWNEETKKLLDVPGIKSSSCVVCGSPATDQHHVIQKGMGGVPAEVERRIPTVSLCRACHSAVHASRLHFTYDFETRAWLWASTKGIWHNCKDDGAWVTFGGRHE